MKSSNQNKQKNSAFKEASASCGIAPSAERAIKGKEKYMRTDLAAECYPPLADEKSEKKQRITDDDGLICEFDEKDGVKITRLEVTNISGQQKIGKPVGEYITVDIGRVWQANSKTRENLEDIIAEELKRLLFKYIPEKQIHESSESDSPIIDGCVLIAGLGNRRITADALGPLCSDGITATRHIKLADPSLFEKLSACELAAVSPGVVGQTGIETVTLIKNAADSVDPVALIVIDALAARNTDRLGTTVQLCDTGISPGSGIGNLRGAINRDSVGVPVIAVGVPTVVDSSTLVLDALERAGIDNIPSELEQVLENGRSFFVSLKESDEAVSALSSLISDAIGNVFGTRFE